MVVATNDAQIVTPTISAITLVANARPSSNNAVGSVRPAISTDASGYASVAADCAVSELPQTNTRSAS